MKYTVLTRTRGNFGYALEDVKRLLQLHDSETKRRPGRPSSVVEVFKRAGVILAVTAWESFIEDTLTEAFEERLKSAKAPRDIQKTFNSVAHAWLSRNGRTPPDLVAWAGDNWKQVLRESLAREVSVLNTPNPANVARISKRYLDRDLTADWDGPAPRRQTARARLDRLITLRGHLVHRTKVFFERRASVKRRDLVGAIALLSRIVQRTEEALGREPKRREFRFPHERLTTRSSGRGSRAAQRGS